MSSYLTLKCYNHSLLTHASILSTSTQRCRYPLMVKINLGSKEAQVPDLIVTQKRCPQRYLVWSRTRQLYLKEQSRYWRQKGQFQCIPKWSRTSQMCLKAPLPQRQRNKSPSYAEVRGFASKDLYTTQQLEDLLALGL